MGSSRKGKRNVYVHSIELKELRVENCSPEEFKRKLEEIPYRGYEVEQISDGRKIVVTKPGGKFTYGHIKREDFMVWIYNPSDSTLWLISHKDIYQDLERKGEKDPKTTIKIIDALERVYSGEEPDKVLEDMDLSNPTGELPEVLLKAYKWIWGQEDCNYPPPKYEGREMSMKALRELREELKKRLKD